MAGKCEMAMPASVNFPRGPPRRPSSRLGQYDGELAVFIKKINGSPLLLRLSRHRVSRNDASTYAASLNIYHRDGAGDDYIVISLRHYGGGGGERRASIIEAYAGR